MPSALVEALAAPIREVQSMVGPGWSGDPATDQAAVLGGVRDALDDVSAATARAWGLAGQGWWGVGADGAADFVTAAASSADALAMRAEALGVSADAAAAAVARANSRLRDIIARFEARAAELEPHLDSPGAAEELLDEGRRALSAAIAVVDELRAALDGQAASLAGPTPAAPAPTAPAGFAPTPTLGSGGGGAAQMGPLSSPLSSLGPAPDPATFREGVAVRLPDGSTALAPNKVAADAVRHALTQLGVPYQWGGTAPGVGLDCSGLTQWAYHEAGLNIPRLAQEQDIGAAVEAGSLRPGDLAVWDGHVAMIVGNGTMIEAGDPVKLSTIRTTNAGQGFQGFWRPTA